MSRVEHLSPFSEFCLNQLSRLKGHKFSGGLTDQAWASLRQVLEQNTESEEHARAVINQCFLLPEMARGCDILEIAKATAPAAVQRIPNGRCGRCNGTGWVHEIRVQQAGPFRGGKYSYAGKCGCWRTQEMAS